MSPVIEPQNCPRLDLLCTECDVAHICGEQSKHNTISQQEIDKILSDTSMSLAVRRSYLKDLGVMNV